jgi:two-component system chemotaxis sensor kinase CheA
MDMDLLLRTFIAEANELLDAMESTLLGHAGAIDDEGVNAIFRAVHTIKGSGGMFSLEHVVGFAHVAENVLDQVRARHLALDEELIQLLLHCGDHLRDLVGLVQSQGHDQDAALNAHGAQLMAQLQRLQPTVSAPSPDALHAATSEILRISLRLDVDVLRFGNSPLRMIEELGGLGELIGVVTCRGALPEPELLDPEGCYLGFEIVLRTTASIGRIEEVFEFVRDECRLHLLDLNAPDAEHAALDADLDADAQSQLRELMRLAGRVESAETVPAEVAPAPTEVVQTPAARPAAGRGAETESIRVDARKLDRLIDLVGELTITVAGAEALSQRQAGMELRESVALMKTLVEDMRESALHLRMIKIGGIFGKFQRVVHDVARELGKDIVLAVSGEDTELDKAVVEKIADPLTHLVRNAMDHGIEPSALRLSRGKPAQGTVTLDAFHDSGCIVIRISDDGGGLPLQRIYDKAVERGLVEPGRTLTDRETYALIFEPGFSTAEQVTNISGRGVGMDVVKRNITALRGTIDIDSRPGLGTCMSIRLPLTLAIIEGFQVRVGESVFVLPLDAIEECLQFHPGQARYVELRGRMLPYLRLRELFKLPPAGSGRESIVVVRHGQQRVGLVVDALLGESQAVIKPLSPVFQKVRGVSGSTIRGNGDIALILDISEIVAQIETSQHHHGAVLDVRAA